MQSFITILISRAAWLYIYWVGITSRIEWLHLEEEEKCLKNHGSFIYAFWHGRQVFITYAYKNKHYTCLVSQSKDGEYIARVIHLFGLHTIRGSSSRGGIRALVLLKQALERERVIGLTPDGPKGPERIVKPGILFLAQKTGKPILPLTV